MTKSFSEYERSIIKQKLIDSCEVCWEKYGYKKTNVSELCRMAGISTGAFYIFYSSKELLFFETAQTTGKRIMTKMEESIPRNPSKYDLAKGLKLVIKELEKSTWLLTLSDEIEVFMRKLPMECLESDYKSDFKNISGLVEKFGLKPKIDLELIVTAFQILFLTVVYKKKLVGKSDEAIEFMIDAIVENSFE